MSWSKPLSEEMKKLYQQKFYESFGCSKCGHHMTEVMPGDVCRPCFEELNMKRKPEKRLPGRAMPLLTEMSKISRGFMDLKVPGDYVGELVLHKMQDLVPKETVLKTGKILKPCVEEYLSGLVVIFVEPITSYSPMEMKQIKIELIKRGVKCFNTSFQDFDKNVQKKILVADHAMDGVYSRAQLDTLAQEYNCPVVDTVDFLNSIRTGCCFPPRSPMSVSQTPKGSFLLWEDPLKMENPSIIAVKSCEIVDDRDFANLTVVE